MIFSLCLECDQRSSSLGSALCVSTVIAIVHFDNLVRLVDWFVASDLAKWSMVIRARTISEAVK